MNEASATLPQLLAQPTQPLREWLGVLVLSTDILKRYGTALPEADRIAQHGIMQAAGVQLAAAMAKEGRSGPRIGADIPALPC